MYNFFCKYINYRYYYCLLKNKKGAQKVWSKDLEYKGTFRFSSRTPHAYKVSYKLLHIIFYHLSI